MPCIGQYRIKKSCYDRFIVCEYRIHCLHFVYNFKNFRKAEVVLGKYNHIAIDITKFVVTIRDLLSREQNAEKFIEVYDKALQ
jgi:hypothetical protein